MLAVLLLVGLVAGDPVRLFEADSFHPKQRAMLARMPMPVGGLRSMSLQAKEQGALVVEQLLASNEESTRCMAKAVCQRGAAGKAKPEMDFGDAIEMLMDMFANMLPDEDEEKRSTNINRVVGAYKVGESMGNEACRVLYQCETDFAEDDMAGQTKQARITCEGAGMICPGLSISCAMCGLYAPAMCGSACTVAGLYCGFGGYACAADSA